MRKHGTRLRLSAGGPKVDTTFSSVSKRISEVRAKCEDMSVRRPLFVVISFTLLTIAVVYAARTIYVSNLSNACMSCLCVAASNCNKTIRCREGYCGPFFMSKIFWRSAGSHVLPDDDPERDEAFPDCAKDYKCAAEIVKFYMARFGKDCNNDNVTDCDDYARIHYHGYNECFLSLDGTNFGRRYSSCRPHLKPVQDYDESEIPFLRSSSLFS